MGTIKCNICGCSPGPFFVWSSSRNFPREKLLKKYKENKLKIKSILEGVPVCFKCYEDLKNSKD